MDVSRFDVGGLLLWCFLSGDSECCMAVPFSVDGSTDWEPTHGEWNFPIGAATQGIFKFEYRGRCAGDGTSSRP